MILNNVILNDDIGKTIRINVLASLSNGKNESAIITFRTLKEFKDKVKSWIRDLNAKYNQKNLKFVSTDIRPRSIIHPSAEKISGYGYVDLALILGGTNEANNKFY